MMTRTPDEIKKGLANNIPVHYHPGDHEPRLTPLMMVDLEELHADALALIQQLQDDNAEKDKRIQQLETDLEVMKDEIDRDCETCKNSGACQEEGYCMWCENKESNKTPCCNCVYGCNWEWRGVTKEE